MLTTAGGPLFSIKRLRGVYSASNAQNNYPIT
ncbi:hypothetical protein FHW89_003144 [Mucilaginibacter sp. SG564]|nr:hypothetical protein [Mucilaginibacter sp. SG564]